MECVRKPVVIREVWEGNLVHEFSLIRSAVKSHYSWISIDTEFPGTVVPDIRNRKFYDLNPDETYSLMKANIDASKLIQLGMTLSDPYGNLPDFGSGSCFVWQFNFREFDVEKDLQNFSSIELLKKHGINFSANKMYGVHSEDFASLFKACFGPNCTWVTFHGGYDFGYLIKALTNSDLPRDLETFSNWLRHYFGNSMYDVKAMMEPFRLRGGLESLAARFNLVRVAGKSHQAGSDSLLTMQLFVKVCDKLAPAKSPSLLNIRHLSSHRQRWLPIPKYNTKIDGPKVAFFDDAQKTPTTARKEAPLMPRSNPRAYISDLYEELNPRVNSKNTSFDRLQPQIASS